MTDPSANPLLEGGIAIAVFGSVMGLVIVPVVRAFISSQKEALELLRQAVEANTEAVKTFQRFESNEHQVHAALIASQEKILNRLDDLFLNHKDRTP